MSPTEAVLSAAAAVTREEMAAARAELIETGYHMVEPMDTGLLVSGVGNAGSRLLAGDARRLLRSCAKRSTILKVRLERQLDAAAADVPDVDLSDLPMPGTAR